MGNCCHTDTDEERNYLVDSDIRSDRSSDKQIKKLLLLGPGSSGKTTLFKQLKIIHDAQGFTDKDRRDYQAQIDNQIIEQMQKLITRGRELMEEYPDEYEDLEISHDVVESASFIELLRRDNEMNEDVAHHIARLWKDPGIRATFELRGKLSIPDSCEYFFNNVHRIAKATYLPSDRDILLVRKRTTGIIEEHLTIKETKFHIFDVGGQRNERKKWIHCFENVTAVIFVASLSCYDEYLLEDDAILVMHETLNLFEEICNSRWFEKTSFILFLNKRDLFEKKIKRIAIAHCFNKYEGPKHDFDTNYNFIKKAFENKNRNPKEKHIYTHCTTATDKDNVERVFNDVQHIVIQNSLSKGGLI
eukprot:217405_1